MRVQRVLVLPEFEQHQPVRIERALEHLELLAARLLHHLFAAGAERRRELRAFAGRRGEGDDQANRHRVCSRAENWLD
jgi:hypothetical protein